MSVVLLLAIKSYGQLSIDWAAVGNSAGSSANSEFEIDANLEWFAPTANVQSGFWNDTIIDRALFVRARPDSVERPNGSGIKIDVLANDTANFGAASIFTIDSSSAAGGMIQVFDGWVFYEQPTSNPAVD